MSSAMISNIQRMSLHDGPGLRTTVFLKGCNLRCAWCHNPETQDMRPELIFDPNRCVGCGQCAALCATGARSMLQGKPTMDAGLCTLCSACTEGCFAGALSLTGRRISLVQLTEQVLKDEKLFRITGGGVTCSGGEPLLQADAVRELLSAMRGRGIHTCVDTAGNVPWDAFAQVLPVTNLFLYDVKAWFSQSHRENIGTGNEIILRNLRRLSNLSDLWIRIPLIPTVNTDQIAQIGRFLSALPRIQKVELLPYHALGVQKSEALGRPQRRFEVPDETILSAAEQALAAFGLPVAVRKK